MRKTLCHPLLSTPPRSRGSICRGACPCVSPMCDTSTAISPRVLGEFLYIYIQIPADWPMGEFLIVFGVARSSSSTFQWRFQQEEDHEDLSISEPKKWRKTRRLTANAPDDPDGILIDIYCQLLTSIWRQPVQTPGISNPQSRQVALQAFKQHNKFMTKKQKQKMSDLFTTLLIKSSKLSRQRDHRAWTASKVEVSSVRDSINTAFNPTANSQGSRGLSRPNNQCCWE